MPDDDKIQPKKKDQPNRITIQKYAFCKVIINPVSNFLINAQ
jgi:hypothetical protein